MYPTDDIYPKVFNFSETESPIEHFEILGYEGANFVELSGSLLINVVVAFAFEITVTVVEIVCIKYYTHKFARKLGSSINNSSFVAAIVIMYMQAFMESLICGILSVSDKIREVLSQGTPSDVFSSIFSQSSLLILGTLILFIWLPLKFSERT
jgi:hypothetical protein